MAQVRSGNANATKENNALRENVLQVSSKLTNIVKENNALRVNVVKETNALREQKLLTDELKVQIREVSDRENMTSANLSKANIAYNALREQAQQKLSQASEFINQLKVRYNRIAHWEEVQDNVEKAKEISKSVAILKKLLEHSKMRLKDMEQNILFLLSQYLMSWQKMQRTLIPAKGLKRLETALVKL